MKFKILLPILLIFLLLLIFVRADTVTVPAFEAVWWNDTITVSGVATYTNGSAIANADVSITVSNRRCETITEDDGSYLCTFTAPLELGNYELKVNVTNSTGSSIINTTTLLVQLSYGKALSTEPRGVYEIPFIMQEPSGRIRTVVVVVTAWRR
jgi:hypothetical protein